MFSNPPNQVCPLNMSQNEYLSLFKLGEVKKHEKAACVKKNINGSNNLRNGDGVLKFKFLSLSYFLTRSLGQKLAHYTDMGMARIMKTNECSI